MSKYECHWVIQLENNYKKECHSYVLVNPGRGNSFIFGHSENIP